MSRKKRQFVAPPPVGSIRKLASNLSGKQYGGHTGNGMGLGKGTVVVVTEHTPAHPLNYYGAGCMVTPQDKSHDYHAENFYVAEHEMNILAVI